VSETAKILATTFEMAFEPTKPAAATARELLNIKIIRSKSILMSHHSACFAAVLFSV
jgi:hypothetical protein